MKKIFFFVIILFAATLTACTAQPVSAPTQLVKATFTASSTSKSVAISTPTVAPATSISTSKCATTTLCATLTARPTKMNTTTPNPMPTAIIHEDCIHIEPKLPDGLTLSGVWVINMIPPFLEDINTHARSGIIMRGGGNIDSYRNESMAVSPDGTTLAYIDAYIEVTGSRSIGRSTKRLLRVLRSSGYALNMDYWVPDWQSIIGWVDNENLALAIGKTDIVILNPATGKWKKFDQPTWAIANYQKGSWYDAPYSPTLQWYFNNPENNKDGTSLTNVQTGQVTWHTDGNIWSHTEWAKNGTSLVIPDNESLLIIKDGVEADRLETERLGYDNVMNGAILNFSPDGQKLAFSSTKQIANGEHGDTETKPTLYNIAQHTLGRLCAKGIETSYWESTVIWSPDSRYFVQIVYEVTQDRYGYDRYSDSKYLLVDAEEMQAYFLENGPSNAPVAWLAKP